MTPAVALTKADWYRATREIYASAMAADPEFTDQVAIAVTGGTVFAWDCLTLAQLRQLHRHLFATARSV
jgi:hypothetical protein